MNRVFGFIGIIVGTQFIVSLPAIADTTYVSGHITSDTSWTKANSPYIVDGDVYVDSLVTLTIESGVEVKIDSMKCIEIYGTLNAIGIEGDSILISALDTTKRWSRLWFQPVSVGSLKYCRIEYAYNSAIYNSTASSLYIGYNTITDNFANGGGISSYGSPTITGNTITNNSGFAGGICSSGSPTITGNTITNNSAILGGGIYSSGSAIISENTITGNSAVPFFGGGEGGGIYSSGSPVISGNIIEENSACEGGGIYSDSGLPTITGNTIKGNSASYWDGGGIWSSGSPIISGNIIEGNCAGNGGGILSRGFPTITGNTIKGNSGYGGGGICSYGSSIITGNTISGNSASDGGGAIYSCDSFPTIKYNTITDTTASAIYINSDSALIDSNNLYATGYAVYNAGKNDINARYNYWGTTDSATIANQKIWDFYDDSTRGIVYYQPFLTDSLEFGIEEASNYQLTISNYQLSIYPNPSRGKFVIRYSLNEKHNNLRLTIHDISGRLVESFGLDKSSPYKNVMGIV